MLAAFSIILLNGSIFAYQKADLDRLIQSKVCENCDLSFVNFRRLKVVNNIEFKNANLNGSNLKGALLQSVDFSQANLRGVNLYEADIKDVNFDGADLTDAIWINGHACYEDSIGNCRYFRKKDLEQYLTTRICHHCMLENANLSGKDLANSSLIGSNLKGANLQKSNLANSNLNQANLTYSNLEGANLNNSSMDNTQFFGATWINGYKCFDKSVGQCDFQRLSDIEKLRSSKNCRNCQLRAMNLTGENLKNSDLSMADLRDVNFKGAELARANLSGVSLVDADLRRAVLVGADLSGADLRSANIEKADLRDVILVQAKWIDGQICQEGSIGECITCTKLERILTSFGLITLNCGADP